MCAADFACERTSFRCSSPREFGHCYCCAVPAGSEQYLDPYFVGFQLVCCALSLLVLWQWVFAVLVDEEFEVRKQEQMAVVEQEQRVFPSISTKKLRIKRELISTCARE